MIYTHTREVSTLEVVLTKYPKSIIAMESAFYYHGLSDVILDKYWIATNKSSRALNDDRIKQMFVKSELLEIGITTIMKNNILIRIYGESSHRLKTCWASNEVCYLSFALNIKNIF